MALMRLMGSKHISSVRVKMMTTLRTGLRYREDFPLLCCQSVNTHLLNLTRDLFQFIENQRLTRQTIPNLSNLSSCLNRTWECFVRSVEPTHLGPLLSHVIVALLPLIPLQPKETAAIIRFLILDNR